jgi:hypothetical protein
MGSAVLGGDAEAEEVEALRLRLGMRLAKVTSYSSPSTEPPSPSCQLTQHHNRRYDPAPMPQGRPQRPRTALLRTSFPALLL